MAAARKQSRPRPTAAGAAALAAHVDLGARTRHKDGAGGVSQIVPVDFAAAQSAEPGEALFFTKGHATADPFRPAYWSFERSAVNTDSAPSAHDEASATGPPLSVVPEPAAIAPPAGDAISSSSQPPAPTTSADDADIESEPPPAALIDDAAPDPAVQQTTVPAPPPWDEPIDSSVDAGGGDERTLATGTEPANLPVPFVADAHRTGEDTADVAHDLSPEPRSEPYRLADDPTPIVETTASAAAAPSDEEIIVDWRALDAGAAMPEGGAPPVAAAPAAEDQIAALAMEAADATEPSPGEPDDAEAALLADQFAGVIETVLAIKRYGRAEADTTSQAADGRGAPAATCTPLPRLPKPAAAAPPPPPPPHTASGRSFWYLAGALLLIGTVLALFTA